MTKVTASSQPIQAPLRTHRRANHKVSKRRKQQTDEKQEMKADPNYMKEKPMKKKTCKDAFTRMA